MRLMGIDYGEKRIGIAVSDVDAEMAFAKYIIQNTSGLIDEIGECIKSEDIGGIVIGESLDFDGNENPIMKRIHPFKEALEKRFNIPVYFEPELFSSQAARRDQEEVKQVDAGAATIILQSYIDKQIAQT